MNRPISTAPAARPADSRALANLSAYHDEALESGLADRHLLRQMWPFLRPHRRWLAVAIVAVVFTSALALSRPLIMLVAIDSSIESKDPTLILWGGAVFAVVAILEQLLSFAQIYATQIVGARAMADLRLFVFRFLGRLPLRFFDRQPVGRLVTRVTNDVDAIQELFSSGAVSALGDLLRLVGVVVLMWTLEWKLSLVAFATMPAIGILVVWVRRRAREVFRSIRGETARMNATMNEQVAGMALVQAYGREDAMFEQFDHINSRYRDAYIRSIKYDSVQDAAIDAVSGISLASIIVALGYHHASYGTVVALTVYLSQFFEPISMLAQRYTLLQSALSGAERIFGLLTVEERDAPGPVPSASQEAARAAPSDEKDAASSPEENGAHAPAEYAIEFDHVTFGYKPGVDVLHEVSLWGKPGETLALVGPTGSGKTTITALALQLYQHDSGRIRVFGKDVRAMERRALRRKFAVVPQDVFLFSGTLAENVAAGEEPDRDRVRSVFDQMGLSKFFEQRGGLECEVRAQGSNFSAGERQLIAFARALYRDAPILILDEATASVDSETEAHLQKAILTLIEGRTAIVVAHRLSTIRAADRICVLQKGRVVERGSHEELLQHGGLYSALHDLQFARTKKIEGGEVAERSSKSGR